MEINNEGSITPPLNSQFKKRAAFDIDRIHPDDAKDKVFIGIIKALIKMDNKPSSPKELAGFIIKHKLAVLGGATPYATVSSRISQHFKRATEHKPPRKPLLAKSFDLKHTRKIRYCLDLKESNGDESEGSQSSPTGKTQDSTPKTVAAKKSPVPSSSSSVRSKSVNRDSSPLEDSSLDVIDVESEDEVVEVSTTKEIIPEKKSPVFVKSTVKRI
ncbi:hypothetical protein CONCODRAFT_113641 [Conidiobolus coronatus NRRL 28638]|uniref:GDS1 winged helix domain-containing protein n=1 Tax=Conidiobolus coronatus (strain ATCC 28846 / CBS 209.66 / NRRL 28638) TaxID=796925 RepID=A0A137NY85_CONC2|nr:hypothetical protein CONCODRAFT_113641 [Conidiobolus coronatus NRRL 28638]|eukprot:KXN67631.1 hypothetical protein CONCODRAFT_113641 [Conidiobolus coronatus NRRL 28638]